MLLFIYQYASLKSVLVLWNTVEKNINNNNYIVVFPEKSSMTFPPLLFDVSRINTLGILHNVINDDSDDNTILDYEDILYSKSQT